MGGDHLLPKVSGIDADSSERKNISESRAKIFKSKYLPTLKVFPQTKEFLETLQTCGLETIIAALKKASCSATEVVMIGDTPYDIEAALQAGVQCIGFSCGGWKRDQLSKAVEVYEGPEDLLEKLSVSILKRSQSRG